MIERRSLLEGQGSNLISFESHFPESFVVAPALALVFPNLKRGINKLIPESKDED